MNPKYQVSIHEINLFAGEFVTTKLKINNISKVKGLKRPIATKAWDISFYVDDVLDTERYYEFKIKHGVDNLDNISYLRLFKEPIGYYLSKDNLVFRARFENNLNHPKLYTIKVFQNPDTFLLHLYIFLQESVNSLPF